MLGDTTVKASSAIVTYRENLATGQALTKVGTPWYVLGLPRQFVWANQTDAGAAATLRVHWAIRDSATPATPEWLLLQNITLVPGGATPVLTMLGPTNIGGTGAVWLRFTLVGAAAQTVEIAASAFV